MGGRPPLCGIDAGNEDRDDLVGFRVQASQPLFGNHTRRDHELEPVESLVGFLQSDAELGDEVLAKIAHELTDSLRQNVTVDWSNRDSVRAKLRLLVKRILRKYKYPPDQQEEAAQLVLAQAETLCEAWM